MSEETDPKEPQAEAPPPPNYEPIMQFFAYHHLPGKLQPYSKPFHDLAHNLMATLPKNPERAAALRKLLEAKDAAVRSFIFKDPVQ